MGQPRTIHAEYLNRKTISDLVRRALVEDAAQRDLTSKYTLGNRRGRAVVVARKPGVVTGLVYAREAWRQLGGVRVRALVRDGAAVKKGTKLLRVEGKLAAILAGERTALNFLGHLSGVATLTARFVAKIRGTRAGIYDTRKTIPGLRWAQKEAVVCGGGRNHRLDLAAMALVKDNHRAACGSPAAACRALKAKLPKRIRVMVEIERLADLEPVLAAGADYILLDNMTPALVTKAVRVVRGRVPLEVSGGINLDNVRAYARTGVARISVGALTHSAPALDVSMDVE